MIVQTNDKPGIFERHLLRRYHHAQLFNLAETQIWDDMHMMEAQQQDYKASREFQKQFQQIIQKTTHLKPNEDSEVILKIKSHLDKLYTLSATLADDQTHSQAAIRKLLIIITTAIRKGAGNDALAHQELDQEDKARETHFQLLQSVLVADLIDSDSPIKHNELIPTLLSSTKDELSLTLQIFDENQLVLMIRDAKKLLEGMDNIVKYKENLVFMQGYIQFLQK